MLYHGQRNAACSSNLRERIQPQLLAKEVIFLELTDRRFFQVCKVYIISTSCICFLVNVGF